MARNHPPIPLSLAGGVWQEMMLRPVTLIFDTPFCADQRRRFKTKDAALDWAQHEGVTNIRTINTISGKGV